MMTQDEVESFADRMKAAKEAKAVERMEAEARGEPLESDSAPKAKRKYTKRKGTARPRAASTKPPSLRAPIKAMLETVGTVWDASELLRGHAPLSEDYATCGSVLFAQADSIATNLNGLAQQDPTVYRWLDRMMTTGGWGGVALAAWPVAAAVLQAHVMPRMARRGETVEEQAGEQWPPEQAS